MRYKKFIILFVELVLFIWTVYRSWQLIAFGTLFIFPVLLGYSYIKRKRKFIWQEFFEKRAAILRWLLILSAFIFSRLFGEDIYNQAIFSIDPSKSESERLGVGLIIFISAASSALFFMYISLFWRDFKKTIRKNKSGFPLARE